MEILIILFLLWLVGHLWGKSSRTGGAGRASTRVTSPDMPPPQEMFEAEVAFRESESDGQRFDILEVFARGPIEAPSDGAPVQFVVHILSGDGRTERKPVWCALEQLQEVHSYAFEYSTEPQTLPYQSSLLAEPTRIVAVPLPILVFPNRGKTRIFVRVDVVNAANPPDYHNGVRRTGTGEPPVASATATASFVNSDTGYLEAQEAAQAASHLLEEATVRLALYIAAADGALHKAEGALIREWLRKRVARHVDSGRDENTEKRRLNGIVQAAYDEARANALDPVAPATRLREGVSDSDRYDAFDLCSRIAAADGRASADEMRALQQVAKGLGLDREKVQRLHEKILPIQMHEGDVDPAILLMVDDTMPTEEVRERLNREFQKWNARVTHSDANVREQAERMLERIAECRRRYVG